MRKILLLLVLLLQISVAWAIPAHRGTFKHTQHDGSVLTLRLMGDEHMHYYMNVADQSKMYKGEDGDYYQLSEESYASMQEKARVRRHNANARRKVRMRGAQRVGEVNGNMRGKKNGLIILVNYKDVKFKAGHTQAVFDDMFNKEGYNEMGHIGSVRDYFLDQSYGALDITFDVVGPVQLAQNMAYYGGNNKTGDDKNPGGMVAEACKALEGQLDFSKYDWDGDGEVDQVFVIYAGYGENYDGVDENTIWPHEWTLDEAYSMGESSSKALKIGETTINTYACSCELNYYDDILSGIGTACHEFSHCLGFPDTYDVNYDSDGAQEGQGMSFYDTMCSGSYNGPNYNGEVPSGYTAYERWMAGWLTPTELTSSCFISNMSDIGDASCAYIIYNNNNKNEYFLIENRQSTRWNSYYMDVTAGHGLLVTHVDYNATAWETNQVNITYSHQRMTYVPADKNYSETYLSDITGDFFGGEGMVTSFNPSNYSSCGGKWFTRDTNGTYYSSHYLSDIKEDANGQISFTFDEGGDTGDRYTISYNAGTGSCATVSWTQTSSSIEATTLPTATIGDDSWTFAGWAEQSIAETGTQPKMYKAGEVYKPTADITLYAVYRKDDGSTTGQYVLDYANEPNLSKSGSWGQYGTAYNYTATDGSVWVVKAFRNTGMQINKGKNASIKVPECPGPISTIVITDDKAKVLSFSDTDYKGTNYPTVIASSLASTTATINLSGKNATTGYIYTTDGATVIKKIEVNYGADKYLWNTNPAICVGEISISQYGYSTFSLPCSYTLPANLRGAYVKAQEAFEGGVSLQVNFVYEGGDVVPAGEALLIEGEEGVYPVYASSTSAPGASATENDLCADYMVHEGKYLTTLWGTSDFDEDVYYYKLTTKNGANFGWYWGADEGAPFLMSRADRAYLAIERDKAVRIKSFAVDGLVHGQASDADAISEIQSSSSTMLFDLSGRQINRSEDMKGVYIKNGRKFVK